MTANYVNLFCLSRSQFAYPKSINHLKANVSSIKFDDNNNSNITIDESYYTINDHPRLFLFSYLPYALIFEAFLSYIPYLIYVTKTKSMIQPVLAEAADMVLLTSG